MASPRPSPHPSPRTQKLPFPAPSSSASAETIDNNKNYDNDGIESDQPDLDSLVTYFLASKRSLACTQHVWRANEIVTAAREALEENAGLAAKNTFVRRAINEQLTAVEAVRRGTDMVAADGKGECKALVETLDEASMRLDETLDVLRLTEVEPAFKQDTDEANNSTDSTKKNLMDFLDEKGVEELHDSIRASLDRVDDAHDVLIAQLRDFDRAIMGIKSGLAAAMKPQTIVDDYNPHDHEDGTGGEVKAPSDSLTMSTEAASPVPSLFQNLEGHATESANLLQSLVRHYDLCVTSLKHTEGGGAAIQQFTGSLANAQDLPTGLGLDDLPDLANVDDAPPQPMDEEERADMLQVLMRDAAEVEDVVGEISERLADMEESFVHIENYITTLRASARQLHRTLVNLSNLVAGMDMFVSASAEFLARWEEEREVLEAKHEELEGTRDFFENFTMAYDGLVVEVARRRNVRLRQEKVLKEAMAKVEQLTLEDTDERDAFMQHHGQHLPADIWAGLHELPAKWDVVPLNGAVNTIPKVRKEALERAIQRARNEKG